MSNKDVKKMTKDELYIAITSPDTETEYRKQCIIENDKRMNVFLKQHLKEDTARGKKLAKEAKRA